MSIRNTRHKIMKYALCVKLWQHKFLINGHCIVLYITCVGCKKAGSIRELSQVVVNCVSFLTCAFREGSKRYQAESSSCKFNIQLGQSMMLFFHA